MYSYLLFRTWLLEINVNTYCFYYLTANFVLSTNVLVEVDTDLKNYWSKAFYLETFIWIRQKNIHNFEMDTKICKLWKKIYNRKFSNIPSIILQLLPKDFDVYEILCLKCSWIFLFLKYKNLSPRRYKMLLLNTAKF